MFNNGKGLTMKLSSFLILVYLFFNPGPLFSSEPLQMNEQNKETNEEKNERRIKEARAQWKHRVQQKDTKTQDTNCLIL